VACSEKPSSEAHSWPSRAEAVCRGDDARGGGAVAGLGRFKRDFLAGVAGATAMAMLARPQYLIMGLSLEHILAGIEPIRATMGQLSRGCDLSWATWHDAAHRGIGTPSG